MSEQNNEPVTVDFAEYYRYKTALDLACKKLAELETAVPADDWRDTFLDHAQDGDIFNAGEVLDSINKRLISIDTYLRQDGKNTSTETMDVLNQLKKTLALAKRA